MMWRVCNLFCFPAMATLENQEDVAINKLHKYFFGVVVVAVILYDKR